MENLILKFETLFGDQYMDTCLKTEDMKLFPIQPILPAQDRRPIREDYKDSVQAFLDEGLKSGLLELCLDPPTISNLVVVKQGEKLRHCVDYTLVNRLLKPNYFPLPAIAEILPKLRRAKYFVQMDLVKGFHQLKLDKDSQGYTAFYGLNNLVYRYTRAPFGLSNTPGHFQAVLTSLLGDLLKDNVVLYIDDLLIFAETPQELLSLTDKVLTRLEEGNVLLSPLKCKFGIDAVEFLGYKISDGKYSLKPDRVKEVCGCEIPTTVKEMRAFLGYASAFREYICGYASLESQLNILCPTILDGKKNSSKKKIYLSEEQTHIFYEIQEKITNSPSKHFHDPAKNFTLLTDASEYGIGALLCQELGQKETLFFPTKPGLSPVGVVSKKLSGSATRWSTYEKELFSIVYALQKFEKMIGSCQVHVITDHRNLIYLANSPNNKVIRWLLFLSTFNIVWEWLPGELNFVADYLSRCMTPISPAFQNNDNKFIESHSINNEIKNKKICHDKGLVALQSNLSAKSKFGEREEADTSTNIIEYKKLNSLVYSSLAPPISPAETFKALQDLADHPLPVSELIKTAHNDTVGHGGVENTLRILKEKGISWKNMKQNVEAYIKLCPLCQLSATARNVSFKGNITSKAPFKVIASDILDFNIMDKKKHVIVYVDSFTLFTVLDILEEVNTKSFLNSFLKSIYATFGIPEELKTDNATYYSSNLAEEFSKVIGYKHSFSISNHSESNGQAENRIREVLRQLRRCLIRNSSDDWKSYIPLIQRHLNFSFSSAIQQFPALCIFGRRIYNEPNSFLNHNQNTVMLEEPNEEYIRNLSISIDFLNLEVFVSRENSQKKLKERYDNCPNAPNFQYQPGDLVLIPRALGHVSYPKTLTTLKGPYAVVGTSNEVITLVNGLTGRVFALHKAECRPFYVNLATLKDQYPHIHELFLEKDQLFVEEILCHVGDLKKINNKKTKVFVKWLGCPDSESSWEPAKELQHTSFFKFYKNNPVSYDPLVHTNIPAPSLQ